MSENILFNNRVRSKNKKWFPSAASTAYTSNENISFKEKCYTFHYNLALTGFTTVGESAWALRHMEIDNELWKRMEEEFKKDYSDYLESKCW